MDEPVKYPTNPILIVDDEKDVLASYKMSLQCNGITNIVLCNDPRDVNKLMAMHQPSVVVLDLIMPHVKGEQVLEELNRDHPGVPVIVITGSMDVETAVVCMKNGAYDYMVKPVEKSRLTFGIRNAIEHHIMQDQVNMLGQQLMRRSDIANPDFFTSIITVSDRMEGIFRYIESIAPSPMPVLILGESGTGKELVAQAIHTASGRKGKLVTVNTAGIAGELFNDTLFGHRKGAFTGADTSRNGLIEQAVGGTLFLDEIGDIDTHTQTTLLRLLQQKEYYQIGSDIPRTSDARIIVATNADLIKKMETGEFRKDFYYRIRTHLIELPALRDRREDIQILAKHFIEEAKVTLNKKISSVPDSLFSLLTSYSFPGNVRELQALIFDAVSCHGNGQLSLAPFQEYLKRHSPLDAIQFTNVAHNSFSITFPDRFPQMKEIEEICIQKALEISKGNQVVASALLGLSQSTLSRRQKDKNTSAH